MFIINGARDTVTMMQLDGNTLATTQTSLDVVRLVNEREGATLGEVTEELGISRSSAHNHLTTLRANGILTKKGNTYHLGMWLFHLGSRARERKDEYRIAREKVRELGTETGEDADFYVEEHGRCFALYDTSNRPFYPSGKQFNMHCVAIGKAILAEWSTERVETVLDRWGMAELTENTITSRSRLFDELDVIRDQGYAIADEEVKRGLRAVGAAVKQPDGSVLGGFSIVGPTYKLDHEKLHGEYSALLRETVADVEDRLAELGHVS